MPRQGLTSTADTRQRAQRMTRRTVAAACLTVVSCVLLTGLDAQSPAYDLVIRHGTILDGTGGAPYAADLGIVNGFIARIGELAAAQGAVEIDASGLYVTPGFINIHSHASPDALPTAENMLTQGVTTEIVNADGGGTPDLARQLGEWAQNGLAVNLGAYIGFNSAGTAVMGPVDRRATPDDIARMRAIVI